MYRSPIYVEDIAKVILHILDLPQLPPKSLYNMGGPERLSRLDMATKVVEARGYNTTAVVPAPSASVQRPVASPADISMSVENLTKDLGLVLTTFSDALQQIPAEVAGR